jgi:hypothetical protein
MSKATPRLSEPRTTGSSLIVSSIVCVVALMGFIWSSGVFLHWFILPLLACGTLIGADAVDWYRGRFRLLDPAGLLGLLGLHFFFLAPLLHVHWDQWMGYVIPPPDWRPWLGGMALINCVGLLLYRLLRGPRDVTNPQGSRQPVWTVSPRKFVPIASIALAGTAVLQYWVYQKYGGILGYIDTYMQAPIGPGGFRGMGMLFTVSESFPVVAMMTFCFFARTNKLARSWVVLSLAMFLYFVFLLLFGGLRGGRGNTVFQLFWGFGMLHLLVRPMSKKVVAVGLVFVIGFMYLYGFYKESGLQGLATVKEGYSRADLEKRTGRTIQGAILGDLARSDVQAFLLYRLWPAPMDYEYAWGRTYVGALALLIPRGLWPDRPLTKVKEGTELMFGRGSHQVEGFEAPNVYGLAGEAMLNYGVVAAPLSFIALGLAVKGIRRLLVSLDRRDIRLLLMPFLVILAVNLLTGDSDNLLFIVVKFGAVPFLVVAAGSGRSFRRRRRVQLCSPYSPAPTVVAFQPAGR